MNTSCELQIEDLETPEPDELATSIRSFFASALNTMGGASVAGSAPAGKIDVAAMFAGSVSNPFMGANALTARPKRPAEETTGFGSGVAGTDTAAAAPIVNTLQAKRVKQNPPADAPGSAPSSQAAGL